MAPLHVVYTFIFMFTAVVQGVFVYANEQGACLHPFTNAACSQTHDYSHCQIRILDSRNESLLIIMNIYDEVNFIF